MQESPPRPTPAIQWLVWGPLGLVVAGIIGLYVRERLAPPLPVISQVADFKLADQQGNPVTLADLRGKVWVADIIFTRCPGPCLQMTQRMQALQSALPPGAWLVSITTDPDFDTPSVLAKYAARFGAQSHRWRFLTGTRDQVRTLAVDSLKLVLQDVPAAQRNAENDLFIHSTLFVVVDAAGRVRAAIESEPPQHRPRVVAAVARLLREK